MATDVRRIAWVRNGTSSGNDLFFVEWQSTESSTVLTVKWNAWLQSDTDIKALSVSELDVSETPEGAPLEDGVSIVDFEAGSIPFKPLYIRKIRPRDDQVEDESGPDDPSVLLDPASSSNLEVPRILEQWEWRGWGSYAVAISPAISERTKPGVELVTILPYVDEEATDVAKVFKDLGVIEKNKCWCSMVEYGRGDIEELLAHIGVADDAALVESVLAVVSDDMAHVSYNTMHEFLSELDVLTRVSRIDPDHTFTVRVKGANLVSDPKLSDAIMEHHKWDADEASGAVCDFFPQLILEGGGKSMMLHHYRNCKVPVLQFREALRRLSTLFGGLSKFVDAGFVHMDIRPENLLIEETGKISLIDFGFSMCHDDVLDTKCKDKGWRTRRTFPSPPELCVAYALQQLCDPEAHGALAPWERTCLKLSDRDGPLPLLEFLTSVSQFILRTSEDKAKLAVAYKNGVTEKDRNPDGDWGMSRYMFLLHAFSGTNPGKEGQVSFSSMLESFKEKLELSTIAKQFHSFVNRLLLDCTPESTVKSLFDPVCRGKIDVWGLSSAVQYFFAVCSFCTSQDIKMLSTIRNFMCCSDPWERFSMGTLFAYVKALVMVPGLCCMEDPFHLALVLQKLQQLGFSNDLIVKELDTRSFVSSEEFKLWLTELIGQIQKALP
mmetsp:Transcript_42551/g.83183  ORF Transcript_42551/g.83183 Transcript_42551/m.83183 type:complete len:664 (+) Transcript_42551:61-2052(+)